MIDWLIDWSRQAVSQFTYPGGIEDWDDLYGLLYTRMVYQSNDSHLSAVDKGKGRDTCYSASCISTWPAALYNFGSGSWLAWANDTVAHYAAIHCPHQWTIGTLGLQLADIPPHQTATLGLHPIARKLLLISCSAEGRRLSWPEHTVGWQLAQGCLQMTRGENRTTRPSAHIHRHVGARRYYLSVFCVFVFAVIWTLMVWFSTSCSTSATCGRFWASHGEITCPTSRC